MRSLLPAIAAAAASAMPASASAQSSGQDGNAHWWSQSAFASDHRVSHPRTVGIVATHYYGGEWARHNNRGWAADSYNDWWHDRPDRAYPRWTRTNQKCERIWWSGSGWRC